MIAAVIQARVGSTRLPGKVLMKLGTKTLLEHVIERVQASRLVEDIIVATTTSPQDKPILDLAKGLGVNGFSGSPEDVLDRFYKAATRYKADVIVRITADDPFKDPQVIDKVIGRYMEDEGGLDYVSNTIIPTYPEGLDVEVFSSPALERAWQEAQKTSDREHVTPYIWGNPDKFRLAGVTHNQDLSNMRWTIDYPQDMEFAREVYHRLYNPDRIFLMEDILKLLEEEPGLADVNQGIIRNAGYNKSIKEE